MSFKFIKLNRAMCLLCKDVLTSPKDKPDKLVTCRCGNLTISGGSTHSIRKGKNYQDMCILDFSDCPEVRTDTPKPPPMSTITVAELDERKRKLNDSTKK